MTEKKILLYDATLLSNALAKNAARSGIFFTAYNIFKYLLASKDIELKLYCHPGSLESLRTLLETEFKNYPAPEILNEGQEGYFFSQKGRFIQKKHDCRAKGQKLGKTYYHLLAQIMGLVSLLPLKDRRWAKKLKNVDVFLSPVFAAPPEIRGRRAIKKFTVLYDTIPLLFPEYFDNASWYLRLISSMNGTDRYFAISESAKNDFIKYVPAVNPKNITVTPLGANQKYRHITDAGAISAARGKYNIPEDKKYLLSVCTLEPRKNLIFAVRNFIAFIRKNNIEDMVFVLGGAPWDSFAETFGRAMCGLEKYKDKIIQAGYIDDGDMNAIYSGAEMFVYPSLYEGFGMPVLEAMHCGAPVICSNTSSLPEVAGEAALLVNPDKDGELVEALEKFYFDGNLRKEYIKKGLERAKEFSWEKTCGMILDEIQKCSAT